MASQHEVAHHKGSGPYWFKPRRYGHGATPTVWQGWTAVIAIIVVLPLVALGLMWAMPNIWGILASAIFIPLAVLSFVAFVRKKTDGEWRWRWGDKT